MQPGNQSWFAEACRNSQVERGCQLSSQFGVTAEVGLRRRYRVGATEDGYPLPSLLVWLGGGPVGCSSSLTRTPSVQYQRGQPPKLAWAPILDSWYLVGHRLATAWDTRRHSSASPPRSVLHKLSRPLCPCLPSCTLHSHPLSLTSLRIPLLRTAKQNGRKAASPSDAGPLGSRGSAEPTGSAWPACDPTRSPAIPLAWLHVHPQRSLEFWRRPCRCPAHSVSDSVSTPGTSGRMQRR